MTIVDENIRYEIPKWIKLSIVGVIVTLLTWLLGTAHHQELQISQIETNMAKFEQTISVSQANAISDLHERVSVLNTEFDNLKALSVSSYEHYYTDAEALSRIQLQDDRYRRVQDDHKDLKLKIKDAYKMLYNLQQRP